MPATQMDRNQRYSTPTKSSGFTGLSQASAPVVIFQSTPGSSVSVESNDESYFWNINRQRQNDGSPGTPLTSPASSTPPSTTEVSPCTREFAPRLRRSERYPPPSFGTLQRFPPIKLTIKDGKNIEDEWESYNLEWLFGYDLNNHFEESYNLEWLFGLDGVDAELESYNLEWLFGSGLDEFHESYNLEWLFGPNVDDLLESYNLEWLFGPNVDDLLESYNLEWLFVPGLDDIFETFGSAVKSFIKSCESTVVTTGLALSLSKDVNLKDLVRRTVPTAGEIVKQNRNHDGVSRRRTANAVKGARLDMHIVPGVDLGRILHWNILERLLIDHKQCVADLVPKEGQRCSLSAKFPLDALQILYKIYKKDEPIRQDKVRRYVLKLIESAVCGTHYNCASKELDKLDMVLNESPSDLVQTRTAVWLKALSYDERSRAEIETISTQLSNAAKIGKLPTKERRTPRSSAARLTITGQIGYVQKFESYLPSTKRGPVSSIIRRELEKARDGKEETKRGHIYMYWFEGNFGYIKIGHSNDLKGRKTSWVQKCKHDLTYIHTNEEVDRHMIPHVRRTEILIQAELKDVRYQETACVCGVQHNEWFLVPFELARKVVEKWTTWMSQERYEPVLGKNRVEWRLKESVTEQEIRQLCEPTTLSVPNASTKKRTNSLAETQKRGVRAIALRRSSRLQQQRSGSASLVG